jgi:hypothetical protein
MPHWTLAEYAGNPYYMQDEEFEWDDGKAADNLRDHGIAFDKAVKAFADPFWGSNGSTTARVTARSVGIYLGCARV